MHAANVALACIPLLPPIQLLLLLLNRSHCVLLILLTSSSYSCFIFLGFVTSDSVQ